MRIIKKLCSDIYFTKKMYPRYQSTNEIMAIKEYWTIFGPNFRTRFFPQPCSFRRMLREHKNIYFTPIPDKTNDLIFYQSPKNLVFWPFLTIFSINFFKKNPALSHMTKYGSLTLY